MRPDSDGEQKVLCLKRETLERAGLFQGLSLEVDRYFPLIENRENHHFLPRSEAENDFRYKQCVPYVLILRGDRILRYRRGRQSGERRLLGLYSIGVGGHIDERDFVNGKGYETGLQREVKEETGFQVTKQPTAFAVLNDDSNEVGKAHFGVAHLMRLNPEVDGKRGCELSSPEFIRLADARQNLDRYETWSQWCLQEILPELLATTKPDHRL